jgi:hypothetical protein
MKLKDMSDFGVKKNDKKNQKGDYIRIRLYFMVMDGSGCINFKKFIY